MISQVRIEDEIVRLSGLREGTWHDLAAASQAAAEADTVYRRDYAKAFLDAETAYGKRRATEAIRDSLQERARSIRAQLAALQTLAANQRALRTG